MSVKYASGSTSFATQVATTLSDFHLKLAEHRKETPRKARRSRSLSLASVFGWKPHETRQQTTIHEERTNHKRR